MRQLRPVVLKVRNQVIFDIHLSLLDGGDVPQRDANRMYQGDGARKLKHVAFDVTLAAFILIWREKRESGVTVMRMKSESDVLTGAVTRKRKLLRRNRSAIYTKKKTINCHARRRRVCFLTRMEKAHTATADKLQFGSGGKRERLAARAFAAAAVCFY